MRKVYVFMLVVALAAVCSSCADRKVSRVASGEVIDLSGNWNDTDSQMVSEEMIKDLLNARWLPVYEAKHGDKRLSMTAVPVWCRQARRGRSCVMSGTSRTKAIPCPRLPRNGVWN